MIPCSGYTLCRTMFGPQNNPQQLCAVKSGVWVFGAFLGYRWSSVIQILLDATDYVWPQFRTGVSMATKKPNASPERAEFPYENGHSEVKSTIFYHIFRHQQAPKTAPKTINPPFSVTKSTCMRLQRLQPSGDVFPICSKSVPGANLELPNELEMERTAECSYPVKIVCR